MFTPVESSIGAFLLHQATSNLLYQNGNILGASGYLRNFLSGPTKETLSLITGMAASYLPLRAFAPHLVTDFPDVPLNFETIALTLGIGFSIGWGTKVSTQFTEYCHPKTMH